MVRASVAAGERQRERKGLAGFGFWSSVLGSREEVSFTDG